MKIILMPFVLVLFIMPAIAQKASVSNAGKKSVESEKKFTLGMNVGLGSWTEDPKGMNAGMAMQGEYKVISGFSLYSELGYHRLFALGENGSFGYASLLAGPRAYFTPKFFAGVGGGIAFASAEGESATIFNYNPHIGYNAGKAQFTIGYDALSDQGDNLGFVSLKALVKFGK